MSRLTGADLEAAIADASPLVDPRLSEVDWDAVAVCLARPGLRAALQDAYVTLDAASKWAAHQRPESDTLRAADEHIRGYDALLDGQVRAGQALGILSGGEPA